MARNTIKGKNTRPGSNKATSRDYSYDKKYQSSPERIAYRVELNRKNRDIGRKGDGLDVSHKKGGGVTLERASKNRARNGSNGRSTKK